MRLCAWPPGPGDRRAGRFGFAREHIRALESLGYLASYWEDARAARRDKRPPRRYFDLTAAGAAALADALKRYKNLKPVSLSAWRIRPSEA